MENEAMQLRISDILHVLLKNRLMILIMTLIGLGVGIVLSIVSYMRGEMSKEYAITSSIAVTSQAQDGRFTNNERNPSSADIYLAENMVDAVIYVIRSDRTLNAAVKRMNLIGVSNRDIYDNLTLRQYNETQIIEMTLYWRSADEGVQILSAINAVSPGILIETLKIGSVSVVNDPTARYRIGGSVNASLWVYMAALGFMAGVGFSVLMLLLQPTLVNTKDLERNFGLEVFGEIPESRRYFTRKRSLLVEDEEKLGAEVEENFSSAAHIFKNRLGKEPHQCIYVTSATGGEGRTSVAAHLAVHLSDMELKVLLIDFDVRNPSLGTLFIEKVDYEHTINALYRGETTMEEAVTSLTGYLDLMPAILEHNGLPLDEAMLSLVQGLAENYDVVLMDTSPVGKVADTMNLNRIAHNALFVARYDVTGLNELQEALNRLEKSGIRTIGCIVNGVKRMGGDADGGLFGGGRNVYRTKRTLKRRSQDAMGPAYEANVRDPELAVPSATPTPPRPMAKPIEAISPVPAEKPKEAPAEAAAVTREEAPAPAAEAPPEPPAPTAEQDSAPAQSEPPKEIKAAEEKTPAPAKKKHGFLLWGGKDKKESAPQEPEKEPVREAATQAEPAPQAEPEQTIEKEPERKPEAVPEQEAPPTPQRTGGAIIRQEQELAAELSALSVKRMSEEELAELVQQTERASRKNVYSGWDMPGELPEEHSTWAVAFEEKEELLPAEQTEQEQPPTVQPRLAEMQEQESPVQREPESQAEQGQEQPKNEPKNTAECTQPDAMPTAPAAREKTAPETS